MRSFKYAASFAVALTLLALPVIASEGVELGKAVGAGEKVTIGQLLADPEAWVDKMVTIEGKITDVCPKAGCWVDISDGTQKIRFKVKDYEIVFEADTKGRNVVAEGIWTRLELSKEQAIAQAKHHAEETGQKFDPSSITGSTTTYRIQGTGAVLVAMGD
jgi:hypothetical protein